MVVHSQATNTLEIVFTYNHPHCDGISGKTFLSDLLKELNRMGKDAENGTSDGSIIRLPESPPVLPPTVEGICKLPLTIPFILKTAWKRMGTDIIQSDPGKMGTSTSPLKPFQNTGSSLYGRS